jgi:phage repressor protein C with HTH and peptisase S24 domain
MARQLLSLQFQQDEARAYVRAVCTAKNIKLSKLAREIGKHPSTLARFVNNKDVSHTLDLKTIWEIAEWSGVPVPGELLLAYGLKPSVTIVGDTIPLAVKTDGRAQWAHADEQEGQIPANNLVRAPLPPRPDRTHKVPLLGSGQAGPDGVFEFNSGDPIDYVDRPQGLLGKTRIYCIRVDGNSMEPAHNHGDLLFVDEARKPYPGRDAVVELHPDHEGGPQRAFIKRIVKLTPDYVELFEFKPKERTFRLARAKIRNLHLVLTNNDMY